VSANGIWSGSADNAAEHDANDDGIVGVSEDRNEVWNEIDRDGEISQEHKEADPHPSADASITGKTTHESDRVGHDADCIAQRRPRRPKDCKAGKQNQPHQADCDDDPDEDDEDCSHSFSVVDRRGAQCASLTSAVMLGLTGSGTAKNPDLHDTQA